MGGDFAVVKDLRDRVSTGKILGPRIKIAGPVLESERWMKWATDNAKKDNDAGMLEILSIRIAITDPEQARETVRKLAGLGVDLVKVRNTHSAEAFLAILSEAKKHNLPVAAHAPRMNLITASDGGLKSIEHVDTVAALRGNVEVDDLAKAFVRNETLYTPTLIAMVIWRLTPKAAKTFPSLMKSFDRTGDCLRWGRSGRRGAGRRDRCDPCGGVEGCIALNDLPNVQEG
jgi:imidazolonepropionase-like amidohydrolase